MFLAKKNRKLVFLLPLNTFRGKPSDIFENFLLSQD